MSNPLPTVTVSFQVILKKGRDIRLAVKTRPTLCWMRRLNDKKKILFVLQNVG